VFAYAGHAASDGPLTLDTDPEAAGVQAASHPGVTNVENYLSLGGRSGLHAEFGPRVRFDLGLELGWQQSHIISFADAGTDRTTDDNDIIDSGTAEVNPLHAPLIDAAGHRYRVDETLVVSTLASLRFLF